MYSRPTCSRSGCIYVIGCYVSTAIAVPVTEELNWTCFEEGWEGVPCFVYFQVSVTPVKEGIFVYIQP